MRKNLKEWYEEFKIKKEFKKQVELHKNKKEQIETWLFVTNTINSLFKKLWEKEKNKAPYKLFEIIEGDPEFKKSFKIPPEVKVNKVMDPLSFYTQLYAYGEERKKKVIKNFLGRMGSSLKIIERLGFEGIGIPQIRQGLKYFMGNKPEEESLKCWNFFLFCVNLKSFEDLMKSSIEFKSLAEELKRIKNVGDILVTDASFYIRPNIFCPWDNNLRKFIRKHKIEAYTKFSFDNYLNYLEEIHSFKEFAYPTVWFSGYIYSAKQEGKGVQKDNNKAKSKSEIDSQNKFSQHNGVLSSYFISKNFFFQNYQISSFYTALKTKGFVILAGLSGTGKTKMAQLFGELFGGIPPYIFLASSGDAKRHHKAKERLKKEYGKVVPYTWAWERSGIEKNTKSLLSELKDKNKFPIYFIYHKSSSKEPGKIGEIIEISDFEETKERQMDSPWPDCPIINSKKELEEKNGSKYWFKVTDIISINPPVSPEEIELKYKEIISHISENEYSDKLKIFLGKYNKYFKKLLFLPVRPDWRDSKSLLGYYNPIMNRYESRPLFEFILKAIADYRDNKDKASPYFVILDEMNLARVEYYFAEFLSVLESGREKDGFTKEGIKIQICGKEPDKQKEEQENIFELLEKAGFKFEQIKNDGIIELKLPPNLYFIGTVNIDETTFMFSPKVLDRAFTIEFKEVNFKEYKEKVFKENADSKVNIQKLKEDFTINGKFLTLYGDKEEIQKAYGIKKEEADYLPERYFENLRKLSEVLRPYNLHFAYRVLDEIALFYKSAKESEKNAIIEFEKNDDEIIDLAVLMKVLPKFHGNRAKLEEPLLKVLYWAKNPEKVKNKKREEIEEDLFKGKYSPEEILELYKTVSLKIEKHTESQKKKSGEQESTASSESNKAEEGTGETQKESKSDSDKEVEFKFPHTAKKALEMLYKLHTDGYAGYL